MEIKEIYKLLASQKNTLMIFSAVGCLLAVLIYLLPPKYIATGSFYVKRATDSGIEFFTYEGHYGQQTAISHTNTIAGLLESVDLQSSALKNIEIPINEVTLLKYSRSIRVKKTGPQLLTLTVKGKSPESSLNLWNSLSTEVITKNKEINIGGDTKLEVSKISEFPVVKKEYKSLAINIPAGIVAGALFGFFIISLKEYA